jgi:hypothetical protein
MQQGPISARARARVRVDVRRENRPRVSRVSGRLYESIILNDIMNTDI